MKHSNFHIGSEFRSATKRYRCTDVGTRTICAIEIDDREDQSWFDGPPYAVDEVSFDEDDLEMFYDSLLSRP